MFLNEPLSFQKAIALSEKVRVESTLSDNLLSASVAGLKFRNPTALASGILGYTADSLLSIVESGAGAVVTKSVGAKPRLGYANPTVVQTQCGLINAMGLPNPGIDLYTEEISNFKTLLKVPLIVSIFGYSAEEYAQVAEKVVKAGADAVELNVSCPHVKQTGSEIGQNPRLLFEVVGKVRASVGKPLVVKLSPNVSDLAEMAEVAVRAGADALTAINTVKALAIDVDTMLPVLSNVRGGLSGPAVKPIALRCVYDVYENVKVPILGCGGITTWQDAVEFLLAGASVVQIGTAVALRSPGVFRAVNRGIGKYLNKKGCKNVKEIVGLAHRT